jgi:hypothetical protein
MVNDNGFVEEDFTRNDYTKEKTATDRIVKSLALCCVGVFVVICLLELLRSLVG